MKILATDLDRTLLPNGKWPLDDHAISLFNEWTAKQGVLVVYVTGRNLQLTEQAIEKYGVRFPDILCGDVGTTIRRYIKSEWHMDQGMFTEKGYVQRSVRFEAELLRSAEASSEKLGLTPSSAAKLGVDLARGQSLADELRAGVEARERPEARHG